jgi:hypothetical protein
MTSLSTAGAAMAALREELTGEVFAPGDPGYDEARTVHNAMIDRRPAVIARCAHEDDVVRAVRFGRELDLPIAVRGGGHSVSGQALNNGGLVIDLRLMHDVTVHPAARAVRVGGRASTTGVGGFVLGGGTGWLDRWCGLAVDNLLGVELVTADARRIQAGPDENADLFWGLHGGGGNFGIATALTLKLHELPEFSLALLLYPPESGELVVRTFRDVIESGPDEVGGGVLYFTGPPAEFVPPHLVGTLLCGMLLTYAGPEAGLRRFAEPLLALPHEASR